MPYHYTDKSREADAGALPDVEIFSEHYFLCVHCEHIEIAEHADCPECGSPMMRSHVPLTFYAFLDGGLDCWSGDPVGPYDTEAEALAAAREAAGCCPHGAPEDGDDVCEECPAPELWALRVPHGKYVGQYLCFRDGNYSVTRDITHAAVWSTGMHAAAAGPVGAYRPYRLTDSEARRWGR